MGTILVIQLSGSIAYFFISIYLYILFSTIFELLPRCERLCQHCSHNLIENELHFVLECPLYNSPRLEFLDNLFQKFPNLRNINLENLFIWIMSNEDLDFNAVFSLFLDKAFQIRQGKKLYISCI